MIVSEPVVVADSDTEHIVCWLVTTFGYRQNAIYRLTAEQCNSDRVNTARLRPVVTLVEVRRGSVGWFTSTDRQTATPGGSDDGQEQQGTTASEAPTTADDVYTDDVWSFLNGSPVINVYNEPYIATYDNEHAEWYTRNNRQPHNSSAIITLFVATLTCISVLFTI